MFLALLPIVTSQLCNYRKYPTTGCSDETACNRFSGMCSQSLKATTTQTSYDSTTASTEWPRRIQTALTASSYSSRRLPEPQQSTPILPTAANYLINSVRTGPQSSQAIVLPTASLEPDGPSVAADTGSAVSLATILIILLSGSLIAIVASVVIYLTCRILRRPVDLFSTSADVFEMTFLSNASV